MEGSVKPEHSRNLRTDFSDRHLEKFRHSGMTANSQAEPIHQPPAPDEHNLVAYLDGELDDAAAMQVEQQLATQPEVRHEVERLARTWDFLDLLPSHKASAAFTEQTLTQVRAKVASSGSPDEPGDVATQVETVARPEQQRQRREFWQRCGLRACGFIGLLLAASAGFKTTYDRSNSETDALLRDYPLINRLDEYRAAGDAKFLKALHESETFHDNTDRKFD